MLYLLFLGSFGLGKLEHFFGISLELAILQVRGAQLLDIRLIDLPALALRGLLYPGRCALWHGDELSLAHEVVKLLCALLP
jgi:hypothetical protein